MNTNLLKLIDDNKQTIKYAIIITAILFVVSGLTVGVFTFSPPTKQVKTEQTHYVTQKTTTSVTITNDTQLYKDGQTIKNAALYPRKHSTPPKVTLTTNFPNAIQKTTATQNIILKLKAKRNGKIYWTNTKTLAQEKKQLSQDTTISTTTQLSIESLADTAQTVKQVYGNKGIITAKLYLITTYQDQRKTRTITTRLPIKTSKQSFIIGAGRANARDSYNTFTTEQKPAFSSIKTISTYLSTLSILFIIIFTLGYYRSDPSRTNIDYILHEYDEWVHTVTNSEIEEQHDDPINYEDFNDLFNAAQTATRPIHYNKHTNAFEATINGKLHRYTPNEFTFNEQTQQTDTNSGTGQQTQENNET